MGTLSVPPIQPGRTDSETIENLLNAYARLSRILDTFSTTVGSDNIPFLSTEETEIRSDKGETWIKGPTIFQYDENKTLRIQQGLGVNIDTGEPEFIYSMFDKEGNPTVYVDSETGGCIFAGDIKTTKDAYVGNNLYIGDVSGTDFDKNIYFYTNELSNCYIQFDDNGVFWLYNTGNVMLQSEHDVQISAGANVQIMSDESGSIDVADLTIGTVSGNTTPQGTWDCSYSSFTGLSDGSNLYVTTEYAAQKGVNTSNSDHTHTVVINGVTYTTSSNSHSHTQV